MSMLSMTGYGKGEAEKNGLIVTVEIKSVNHRYADISVKLPRTFMALENGLRKQVAQSLNRGKVDVYVNYTLSDEALATPVLNPDLAKAYMELFANLQARFGLSGQVSAEWLAGQKDVVQISEADLDEETLHECLTAATGMALEQLIRMRQAEGEETCKDLENRLNQSEQLLASIEERAPFVPMEWQDKLQERLTRLYQNGEADPQRLAQEVAVFADRCDISEEISRFKSHLVQFREMLIDSDPVGRRMDFLVQELNREVNTMGSKSNDAELTRQVVALKAELEKIREQVQNIE